MKIENWEKESMKDDLYLLGYELKGSRDGDTVNKAWNYINELEEKLVEVANSKDRAIKLLREQGYVVKKITKAMEEDAKECEACAYGGDCMS